MDRLGIAFRDITGAYVACAIHKMRPALNMTLLYDPKGSVEDFLKESEERMDRMETKDYLTVLPEKSVGRRDYFRVVNGNGHEGLLLDTGEEGMDTSLINFTIADGLFQRSFVLDILDSYMARVPAGTERVVLALPGYSYRAEDFRRAFGGKNISVIDPLALWVEHNIDNEGGGDLRFYWTLRDFELERRMEEIFQKPVHFRTYYNHPWLRGEVKRK